MKTIDSFKKPSNLSQPFNDDKIKTWMMKLQFCLRPFIQYLLKTLKMANNKNENVSYFH